MSRPGPGRAAARDALRAQTGIMLPPVYPAGYTGMLVTVQDHVGEAELTAIRTRLAALPPPAIVAAALGKEEMP